MSACPVCAAVIPGDEQALQKHVNVMHLDADEERASSAVVADLLVSADAPDSCGEDVVAATLRAQCADDAGLALAIAHQEEFKVGNVPVATLRGSLVDTADYVVPNVSATIVRFYDMIDKKRLKKMHVCSKFDMYSSSLAGLGWDCGYRNVMTFLSCLVADKKVGPVLRSAGMPDVPSIPEIAARIEAAWASGLDPEGANHYEGSLQGKEVWIGATEVVVLFRSLGVHAAIADFEIQSKQDKQRMLDWVYDYFNDRCGGRGCSLHRRTLFGKRSARLTAPLFCQWQGHSITVVGAEKLKSGETTMLIVDTRLGFREHFEESRRFPKMTLIRRGVDHPQLAERFFQFVYCLPDPLVASAQLHGDLTPMTGL